MLEEDKFTEIKIKLNAIRESVEEYDWYAILMTEVALFFVPYTDALFQESIKDLESNIKKVRGYMQLMTEEPEDE